MKPSRHEDFQSSCRVIPLNAATPYNARSFFKGFTLQSTSLRLATFLKRVGALTYDLFLVFAVGFAYSGVIMAIALSMGLEQEHVTIVSEGDLLMMQADEEFAPALSGPLFQAGLVLTILLFYIGFWHFRDATLGMQTWRLKLVDEAGNKPSLGQYLLRAILGFISLAAFGLGYFWMLFDPNKIALHDRFSKTRVIQIEKPKK